MMRSHISLLGSALFALAVGTASAATFSDIMPGAVPNRAETGPDMSGAAGHLSPAQYLRFRQAAEAFDASRFDEAEPILQALVAEVPDMPEPWYLLGLVLANLNRMDAAIEALDAASARYTVNAAPLVMKGDILVSLRRMGEAQAAYRDALERDPSNWLARESLAISFEKVGNPAAAMEQYRQEIESAPADRLFPRYRLADLLMDAGKPSEAAAILAPYVEVVSGDRVALAALGVAQLTAGDAAGAVENLTKSLEIEPRQPAVLIRLGLAQKSLGQFDAAEQTFRGGLAGFPGNVEFAFELGTLQAALARYEDASATLDAALATNPSDRRLMKAQSLVQYRLGHMTEALTLARSLAERSDQTSGDLVWVGVLQEQTGHASEAVSAYEAALSLEPGNWLAANNLASLLSESAPERAVALARAAVDGSGNVASARDTLGWALLNAGETVEALKVFRELVASEPQNALLAYRLGRTLLAAGDIAEAKIELNRALTIDPAFRHAEEARELIASN